MILSEENKDLLRHLFSINTIAKQEKVSVQTIYERLKKKKYDFIKIDGKYFIYK